MASSVVDTAKDVGRKLVNRAETVASEDWGGIKDRAKFAARVFREGPFSTGRGGSRKTRKPDPRKYPKPRSSGRFPPH
jgi:hypothetical protein